ncbi:hypothetical protein ACFS27_13905 [Promicromonospora vindobonensis]|uniref:C2H2-type domain-containing protein n=1 Tax=Promicromonospora vindobonensis TaxID=195748 RepID=A0ABW5VUN5_9MICO
MPRRTLFLCECCALKLSNDDESGCRDFHHHTHSGLDVPAETVIAQGPYTWDGSHDLACHGHEGGVVQTDQTYWVAEVLSAPDDPRTEVPDTP